MFKPLLVSTLLVGMFAMTPAAQADSISIDILPGVTLNIGDRDRRGYYWDGYDWRSERWWREHRGAYRGERNRHGHYWDGWRWRDVGWWREHQRGPRYFDDRRAYREHYRDDRGPDGIKKRDRDDDRDDWDDD